MTNSDNTPATLPGGQPRPPVPKGLREMLKDYPEHIERLQEVLNYVVETSSAGVSPFDRAIWVLEARLETFISEARDELEAAEASGDAEAIARAKDKKYLMGSSRHRGMHNLHDLHLYFQANKDAFE
ncbi:hypothetical protein [Lysobacter enzymogenes]|uniref:hypothetical protein n=1 Tax=Lysobacter enzymogenes TaxID=69 RepID=UPI001F15279F|nr:hypothetical protein [Lysobacter enzymogenes]